MNTKVKKSIMGVMCIMGVVFCAHTAKKDSDARFDTWLQLANVEALASGEAIAVAAAWNFNQSSKAEVELSDIALENVEALAALEHLLPGYSAVYNGNNNGKLYTVCSGSGALFCTR